MNFVSKKLYALEKNVLPDLPEDGTTKITWENGDVELDQRWNLLITLMMIIFCDLFEAKFF
jgi:hypothetical protein